MLTPQAEAASKALIDAVREARQHLTRDAVIWRAVAAAHDHDRDSYWPSREARSLADAAVQSLPHAEAGRG